MSAWAGFGTEQTAKLCGLSSVQIRKLVDAGVVEPSIVPASGPGTRCKFSFDDIVALRVIRALREEGGFSLREVRTVSATLCRIVKKNSNSSLASSRLMVTKNQKKADVQLVDPDGLTSLLTQPGQRTLCLFLLEYHELVEEIKQGAAKLGHPLGHKMESAKVA